MLLGLCQQVEVRVDVQDSMTTWIGIMPVNAASIHLHSNDRGLWRGGGERRRQQWPQQRRGIGGTQTYEVDMLDTNVSV